MQTFDASSLILAWYEYSKDLFPPLWTWIGEQFSCGEFAVSEVAYSEVKAKSPECTDFLDSFGIQTLPVTADVVAAALQVKNMLGIQNDEYHSKGVGENDLLIVATAIVEGASLVSEEGRQQILPDVMSKCKIPAVCALNGVNVECIRFIELLRLSKKSFGA